jgi:O-antigen/teichoic acid export membrane protein
MLGYLSPAEYGVWLTLSTTVLWLAAFDIGLSNGLKNRLTESFAANDRLAAKKYISSAYLLVVGVSGALVALVLVLVAILDWAKILNVNLGEIRNFYPAVIAAVLLFGVLFVLKLLSTVLLSDQKAALQSFVELIGNAMTTLSVYLLSFHKMEQRFFLVTLLTFAIPCVVYSSFTIGLFRGWYKDLAPALASVSKSICTDLLKLGSKFFLIQISSLVMFGSTNVVVSNIFGPDQVAVYGVASKYMTLPIMAFSMLTLPLWTAITEALTRGDHDWIQRIIRRMAVLWGASLIGISLMVILSPWVFHHWIGDKINIPFSLIAWIGVYVAIFNGASILQQFVYGTGDVKKLLWTSLSAGVAFLPLTYGSCHLFGINGIAISLSLVTLPLFCVSGFQYWQAMKKMSNAQSNY